MSKGFRKSLFGFNTDDVLAYIAAADKLAQTNISKLEAEKNALKKDNEALDNEIQALKAKVQEFENQKEQLRIMTENIARIYLSAKTTSKLMVDNANKSRMLIERANSEQLSTIDTAQTSMEEMKEEISALAEKYCSDIENLVASLEQIRDSIDTNNREIQTSHENFSSLVGEKV